MKQNIAPLFRLDNKVAVITGSSKGIGAAMAKGLAEFGAKVVISSRKQAAVDALVEELRADGFEASGFACHVGQKEQLQNLVDQTMATYGKIDILINNAAANPAYGPIEQMEEAVFDKIMEVNVRAPFSLSNMVFPIMQKNGGGSIIHISSVEGLKPSFGLGLYSVSKSALIMLTQNQAKEWGKAGIRVNAICPGLVKTKFSSAIWKNEALLKQVQKELPAGRMAMPEEMVGVAVFLASSAASYCTGGIFTADGGHLLS